MKKKVVLLLTVLVLVLPGCRGLNETNNVSDTVSEGMQSEIYVIADGVYYKLNDIELESTEKDGIKQYFYNGNKIESFYFSAEDCIKAGAVPATEQEK